MRRLKPPSEITARLADGSVSGEAVSLTDARRLFTDEHVHDPRPTEDGLQNDDPRRFGLRGVDDARVAAQRVLAHLRQELIRDLRRDYHHQFALVAEVKRVET